MVDQKKNKKGNNVDSIVIPPDTKIKTDNVYKASKVTETSKVKIANFSPKSSIIKIDEDITKLVFPKVLSTTSYLQPPVISSDLIVAKTEEWNYETAQLRKEIRELVTKLEETRRKTDNKATAVLESKYDELQQKTLLSYIISNVREDAQEKIINSADFGALFEKSTFCNSFVLSIDIRRSTELMLKSRNPELFAEFIIGLCRGLSDIIIENYGVFDKFTGDGILAFFPDFYSGTDSGLFAIDTALKCHDFFAEHYYNHRHCFNSILNDVGLGIGIDFGMTYMVKIQGALTLVGSPVVYACRMSGAKAGDTLLNQPGFEKISEKYSAYFNINETTLNIKNEGETVAHKITNNDSIYNPKKPDWDALIKEFKERIDNSLNKNSK